MILRGEITVLNVQIERIYGIETPKMVVLHDKKIIIKIKCTYNIYIFSTKCNKINLQAKINTSLHQDLLIFHSKGLRCILFLCGFPDQVRDKFKISFIYFNILLICLFLTFISYFPAFRIFFSFQISFVTSFLWKNKFFMIFRWEEWVFMKI